jgi:hypothetical protein
MLFQSITEKITCQFYFFFGKRRNKIISVVGINFIFSLGKEEIKLFPFLGINFMGGKIKK